MRGNMLNMEFSRAKRMSNLASSRNVRKNLSHTVFLYHRLHEECKVRSKEESICISDEDEN